MVSSILFYAEQSLIQKNIVTIPAGHIVSSFNDHLIKTNQFSGSFKKILTFGTALLIFLLKQDRELFHDLFFLPFLDSIFYTFFYIHGHFAVKFQVNGIIHFIGSHITFP